MTTAKEERVILALFKNPEKDLNASSLARVAALSRMHALRIAKKLEQEQVVSSRRIGRSRIFTLDLSEEYTRNLVKHLLNREAKQASPYVRRWISELRRLKNAKAALLFGSVLRKEKEANDIDVLFITDQKRIEPLEREIDALNRINPKPIHPIYQSSSDFRRNIRKKDPVVLNALKGIVAFGEEELYEPSSEQD